MTNKREYQMGVSFRVRGSNAETVGNKGRADPGN